MDDRHRDHHHDRDRDRNRHVDHLDHDRDRSFVALAGGGGAPDFKSHDGGSSKVSSANNHSLDRRDAYSYDFEYDYNYSDGGSFVDALRNERLKIHSFRRELPLCMHLLDAAIQYSEDRDPCGGRLSPSPLRLGCAPEGSFEEEHQQKPVLKEFLSLKPKSQRNPLITELGRAQPLHIDNNNEDGHDSFRSFTKLSREENSSRKAVYMQSLENNNMQLQMNGAPERCESRSSSDEYILIKGDQDEKGKVDGMEGNSRNTTVQRKTRRSWSPDLHQRFLNALQQLGGAQVATPKQIRELMNVDGLTNDEVKSHLQKFRLHMRRPTFTMSPYNHNQGATTIHDRHRRHQGQNQKAHLVLFGGIWVPSSSDLLFTNLESDLTSGRSSSQTTLCTDNY